MKYYQINPNVIFRNYDDFGYITDNRNFGYHFTNASYVLGDRIVSESAAIILSCLEKSPLSINEIANKAMKEFINDTTRIVVAQRIATAKNADKIIVLDGGEIIDFDTHENLMKNCEIYIDIYNSQLKKEMQ